MESRKGIPMSEVELAEWQQAFIDIEESIEGLDNSNPEYKEYLKLKQQELF